MVKWWRLAPVAGFAARSEALLAQGRWLHRAKGPCQTAHGGVPAFPLTLALRMTRDTFYRSGRRVSDVMALHYITCIMGDKGAPAPHLSQLGLKHPPGVVA